MTQLSKDMRDTIAKYIDTTDIKFLPKKDTDALIWLSHSVKGKIGMIVKRDYPLNSMEVASWLAGKVIRVEPINKDYVVAF